MAGARGGRGSAEATPLEPGSPAGDAVLAPGSHRRFHAELPDLDWWLRRVPCQMGCPVHTDCGRYVQEIARGDLREAYLTARAPNPLASVCGRVCAAPCEDQCRRGNFDEPVAIRALKRHLCERFGVESTTGEPQALRDLRAGATEPGSEWAWHLPRLRALSGKGHGRKVAVVGAGPAGLACAHDLAIMGYAVTLFEASARTGGMAFHGIPEFRLPRDVLAREVDAIRGLGVEIRLETPLGPKLGLTALRELGFEAVFLGVGLGRGRDLDVPGRDLDGIVRAVDYLLNVNNGYRVPPAKRALVVGGGFVAFDAARMALRAALGQPPEDAGEMASALDAARSAARAGAEVTLMSLESLVEMPVARSAQGREELAQARAEGIRFLPQRSIVRFVGERALDRVELRGVVRTYDDAGRFAPVFDDSVRETLEADLVILAIGQQADLSFLTPDDHVDLGPGRTIGVDRKTLATSAPGVFAGGDVAFGPRNLIEAEADGKRAAASIHAYLSGEHVEERWRLHFDEIPTRSYSRVAGYDLLRRATPPTIDLGRRAGMTEVESDYDPEAARREGRRCLACHVQTIYDSRACVACNRCVDVCPESCLKLVPVAELDMPRAELEAVLAQVRPPGEEPRSAMLKDDERCIRCGLCAIRCPTHAMTMEVLSYEQRA